MKIRTIQFGTGRLSESSRTIPGIGGSLVTMYIGQELRSNTVPIVITSLELDRNGRLLTIRATEKATGKVWRQWSERKDVEGKMPKEYECDAIVISVDEFTIFGEEEQQGQQQKGK